MRVSYVITFYNKFEFLPPLVESIFNQTGDFENELVIADDGSTPDQLAKLREFIDGYDGFSIQFVETANNTGPAQCFNRGIKAASGDVIVAVDADDICAPGSTIYYLEMLERHDADFIYARRRAKGLLGDDEKLSVLVDPLSYVVQRQVVHMCFAAKADLLKRVSGADPRLFIQDQSLALRMAAGAKIMVRSDKTTVFINGDDGGLSENKAQQHHDRFWMVMNFLDDHGVHGDKGALDDKLTAYLKDTGRSALWKMDRDRGANKLFSPYFWRYIWGQLTGLGPSVPDMKRMAQVCFKDEKVRRVPDDQVSV